MPGAGRCAGAGPQASHHRLRRASRRLRYQGRRHGAKLAKAGHTVKFVSVTNGDAGHQDQGGGALAKRRLAEAQESARRSGIAEYEVLDNHDGELLPTLRVRKQIIRAIREVECRHRARAAAERLSSRPSLHGRAGAGRGVHGGGAERLSRTFRRCARIRSSSITRTIFRSPRRFVRTSPCRSTTCGRRRWMRSIRTSRSFTNGCRGWMAGWRKCPRIRRSAKSG